jgi:hypothetical protein
MGGYDSNVDFETPNGPGDYWGSLRASVGRNWRNPHGQVSLLAGGYAVGYQDFRDSSHADGSLALNINEALSPKVGFTLGAFGAYESTANSVTLASLGLQLPLTQSYNYGGTTGFDFKLGQRTSMHLSGGYNAVDFEDPRLVDSQSFTGGATLSRRLSPHDEFGINYGFLRTKDSDAVPLDTHSATLGWNRILSRHMSLALTGGVGYNPAFETRAQQFYFQGSFGLRGQWRHSSLNFQVGQSVSPAYGLGGNQLSDSVSLSAVVPFGKSVHFTIGGNHTWVRDRSTNGTNYNSDDVDTSLDFKLSRHAGLALAYGFRSNDPEGPAAAVRGHHASFGVTYNTP